MPKIDLHTHSIASDDGGITAAQYRQILDAGRLEYIAVTDHNRIDFAQELRQELGPKIIVGEEIMTTAGELIGLFLTSPIKASLSPIDTIHAIHAQGGIVYLPHPFETVRHGLQTADLTDIAQHIDIVEAHNGRAVFQNRSNQALTWAKQHDKAVAASSDAHGARGIGQTYSVVDAIPVANNLIDLLTHPTLVTGRPPLITLAYPKLNRLRRKLESKK